MSDQLIFCFDTPEETEVSIYALVDPRTPEMFRYVGATIDPWRRLAQHISDCDRFAQPEKHAWIEEMTNAGVQPVMRILATATDKTWRDTERRWILDCLEQGHQLFNKLPGLRTIPADQVPADAILLQEFAPLISMSPREFRHYIVGYRVPPTFWYQGKRYTRTRYISPFLDWRHEHEVNQGPVCW